MNIYCVDVFRSYIGIALSSTQVAELWTEFGDLGEIWFDGGYGGDMKEQIQKLLLNQPNAVGFGGSGVMQSPVGCTYTCGCFHVEAG